MSRTRLLTGFAVILLLAGLAAGAALLSPATDQVKIGGADAESSYQPSASAEDLQLPFYPGAAVDDSFLYRVTTAEGKRVLSYAAARLSTPDPPEKVATFYHNKLPGKPKAETVGDQERKRWVLAVATSDQVRRVTISPADRGSNIELVRASQPAPPAKPLRPRRREQVT